MSIPFGFAPRGDDNNELAAMFEQMGRMLRQGSSSSTSGVNWDAAKSTSRQALQTLGDAAVTSSQQQAVAAAAELAEIWLNSATSIPDSGVPMTAISRTHWLEATFHAWGSIVQPVAEAIAGTLAATMPTQEQLSNLELPEEMLAGLPPEIADQVKQMLTSPELSAMLGPIMNMAQSMSATLFGNQFGQTLGSIAADILCMSDLGIPLTTAPESGLIVNNIETFSQDQAFTLNDLLLYVSLREAAHQRLFAYAPWLPSQILAAIADYARGAHIDPNRIQAIMTEIDPANLENIHDVFNAEMFEQLVTPEQQAALARLELLLALIEGWVTCVVSQGIENRLPSAIALEETFRRRRGAGGPAEKLFAGLLGLELRPRRVREARALWDSLTQQHGIVDRDALWAHPDLLPTTYDLEHPEDYLVNQTHDLMAELTQAMDQAATEDTKQGEQLESHVEESGPDSKDEPRDENKTDT